MSGYVKAYRDRFAHPAFASDPFCRGWAWDWLISNACWKPTRFDIRGRTVTLERGQLCVTTRDLAARWRWSEAAVRRFLTRLKTDAMIDANTDAGRTIITVCNYSKYQDDHREGDATGDAASGAKVTQKRRTKEEGEEDKKKESMSHGDEPELFESEGEPPANDPSPVDQTFEAIWSQWPRPGRRRSARPKARTAVARAIKGAGSADHLLIAVDRYLATDEATKQGGQFVPGLHVWLNDQKYEHFLIEEDPPPRRTAGRDPGWMGVPL